jgi:hypothetical protein
MRLSTKSTFLLLFIFLFFSFPGHVWAQSGSTGDSPPTAAPTAAPDAAVDIPKGVISGKIINKNDAAKPLGDLEVMLHVVDQDQNELGMLHGKSTPDGSYQIADVPFQIGMGYVAAVAFEGTTYYSDLVPAEAGKTNVTLDVPVYESTTELSNVQVAQMHVLFGFASDGMEVKEIYALSNKGDKTVKDGVDVPGKEGVKASIQFPLPDKADFINFEPQDPDRFIKFPGGFVDRASIVPGEISSQFLVSYLLPYSKPLTFALKTVLPVTRLNFVLPDDLGVTLKGEGLSGPEQVTAKNGSTYSLYMLEDIPAGKDIILTFEGDPVIPQGQVSTTASAASTPKQLPLLIGIGVLGVSLIGGAAFWWVRSARSEETNGEEAEVDEFESLLASIAQLDQRYEHGEVEEILYHQQREILMAKAREYKPEGNCSAGG